MARIIPNANSYICFATTLSNYNSPTAAEVAAAVNLTSFVISLNAVTRGNIVQTPAFDNRFETNIPGTLVATFEGDFYRDSGADTAWTTLPRDTVGYFIVSRFGGTGANNLPVATNKVEVWPVRIATRSAQNLTNNTAQTFNVQAAITSVPAENATVS